MNWLKALFALIVAWSLFACASPAVKPRVAAPDTASADRPRLADLAFAPIETPIPKTKRVTLSNGIVVHLLPDRVLPLFRVMAMIKVGALWEPPDKAGLAALTGAAMRSGGTVSRPPDRLDETLEFIAGSVETSIGEESGSASLSVLSKDTGLGLAILADVLRNPRFDPERFDLAKARMLDGIRRENDDPTSAAGRELDKLVYAGTPYGRFPTLESVQSITREDVIAFHKKYFAPQNVMLGVTGDFDEQKIIARLEEVFAGWSGPAPGYPPPPRAGDRAGPRVYLARKKLPQSVIRMGHLSLKRTDPDYQAVAVMDDILGGAGFTSRLVKEIRVDRGLAYSVWSYTFGGRWEKGKFMAGAETKAASTAQTIELILGQIAKIRAEPVSKEELDNAKKSIVNSFVFGFDRPIKTLTQRMTVDYYGLPADYLETFRDKVQAVTVDDVLRAAGKRLRPEALKIVVVGDPVGFDKPLSTFGQVEEITLRDYNAGHGHGGAHGNR